MNPASSASPDQGVSGGRWLWIVGAAGLVVAARLREVQLHAGDTPFLDQWDAEGRQIVVPWLQGNLSWATFFASHNEHVPLWTRLVVWLEATLLGRWDPLLQATVNAVLHGVVVGAVAGWLRRSLPIAAALVLTLFAVLLSSLPFGWENSTWGFQVHTPLALGFVFWHVYGSFYRAPSSPGWWWAQAAGLAACFTYGSMWTAPAAVMLTALYTAAPDRRRRISGAVLAAAGLALLVTARAHQDPNATLTLTAHSPQEFLAAFLLQLGWPAAWPGACMVLCLPGFWLALQLRSQARAEAFDRVTVALAIWSVAQAAAFGFARGGNYIGFVSRYSDLLALGVLAQAVALWRLWYAARSWLAAAIGVFALLWCMVVGQGLAQVSLHGHTEYFHERSAAQALARHQAVQRYLATKDIQALSAPEVRETLYANPAIVAGVLDQPGLADLLPAALRPSPTPVRGDIFSDAAAYFRSFWPDLALSAGLILLLSLALARRDHPPATKVSPASPPGRWRVGLLGALALGSGLLVFLWPKPLEFSPEKRWLALVLPTGAIPLTFHFTSTTSYPDDRLTGGAALWPGEFRNIFFGTHVDGPGFVGTAQSDVFPITSRWLIIPYSGFPSSPGNAIRLRVEDKAGGGLQEFTCPGPNTADVDFWAVDVHEFMGRVARVVLADGRTDATGWVAVAPPQPAKSPERAAALRRDRLSEPTRFGQTSLGVIALSALLLAAWTVVRLARRDD